MLCFRLKKIKKHLYFSFLAVVFCPKKTGDCQKNIVLPDLGVAAPSTLPHGWYAYACCRCVEKVLVQTRL